MAKALTQTQLDADEFHRQLRSRASLYAAADNYLRVRGIDHVLNEAEFAELGHTMLAIPPRIHGIAHIRRMQAAAARTH